MNLYTNQGSGLVQVVNVLFTLLALFHLAYLGVMFGTQSETDDSLQVEVGIAQCTSLHNSLK